MNEVYSKLLLDLIEIEKKNSILLSNSILLKNDLEKALIVNHEIFKSENLNKIYNLLENNNSILTNFIDNFKDVENTLYD